MECKQTSEIGLKLCSPCVGLGDFCDGSTQCCEGLGCDMSGGLVGDGLCQQCKQQGDRCLRDEMCCSGHCFKEEYAFDGVCNTLITCVPDGGFCNNDGDCCCGTCASDGMQHQTCSST